MDKLNLLPFISKKWKIDELQKQYSLFTEYVLSENIRTGSIQRFLFTIWLTALEVNSDGFVPPDEKQ